VVLAAKASLENALMSAIQSRGGPYRRAVLRQVQVFMFQVPLTRTEDTRPGRRTASAFPERRGRRQ
jgi:hypothetical protein